MKASILGQNAIFDVQQRDDLPPQKGKVTFHHVLQYVRLHQVVGVNQKIPGTNDSPPRNFRMRGAVRFTELVRRFPDDFEVAANRVQNHLLLAPVPSQAIGVRQDAVDTLADMGQIEAAIFHGQLEGQGFRQHPIPDDRVQAAGIDEIDGGLQKFAKVLEQGAEVKDILTWIEVHEKVDIASWNRFAPRDRTENSHVSRTVTLGQRENRRALFELERFERHQLLLCIIAQARGVNDDITARRNS